MPYNIHMAECYNCKSNKNIFATEKQVKSALAMAQISQIMANDERFGGAFTKFDGTNDFVGWRGFAIIRILESTRKLNLTIVPLDSAEPYQFLTFNHKEQAMLFLEENEDLVKDYYMMD